MKEDLLTKMQRACLNRLSVTRVDIKGVDRLADFEKSMQEIGAGDSHPMISTSWHDLSTADGFGLEVWVDGKLAGGLAARHHDLGRAALAEHWADSYKRLYGGGETTPVSNFCAAARGEIRGRIVYLGQLYLEEKYRGTGINLGLILHYMHALSVQKWSPDWIYGFVRQADVLSGRAAWYGFTRQYVCAQVWDENIATRSSDEYLVAVTPSELSEAANFCELYPGRFCPDRDRVKP